MNKHKLLQYITICMLAIGLLSLAILIYRHNVKPPMDYASSTSNKVEGASAYRTPPYKNFTHDYPDKDNSTISPDVSSAPISPNSLSTSLFTASIHVINGSTGEALPHMKLDLTPVSSDSLPSSAISDLSGYAKFMDIQRGDYDICIAPAGRGARETHTVSLNDTNKDITIVFGRFEDYTISILDPQGSPIANTSFTIKRTSDNPEYTYTTNYEYDTDHNGEIIFKDYIPSTKNILSSNSFFFLGRTPDNIERMNMALPPRQREIIIYAKPYDPITLGIGILNAPSNSGRLYALARYGRYACGDYVKDGIACIIIPRTNSFELSLENRDLENRDIAQGNYIIFRNNYDISPMETKKDILIDLSSGKKIKFKVVQDNGEVAQHVSLMLESTSIDSTHIQTIRTLPSDINGMIETCIRPSYRIKAYIVDSPDYMLPENIQSETGCIVISRDDFLTDFIKIPVEQLTLLAGCVINSEGSPVKNARVWVTSNKCRLMAEGVKTDDNGEYILHAYSQAIDTPYIVWASESDSLDSDGGLVICRAKDESRKTISMQKRIIKRFPKMDYKEMKVKFISDMISFDVTQNLDALTGSIRYSNAPDDGIYVVGLPGYSFFATPYIQVSFNEK